jgi:hypothetical protein
MEHMKATTFWNKRKDSDDNSTNINKQQDNNDEEAKGRWVLAFWLFFCLGFIL